MHVRSRLSWGVRWIHITHTFGDVPIAAQRAVSDQARPDLDALFNVLLSFAKEMLTRHGEFYPFAAMVSADGKIVHVSGDTGEKRPKSVALIDVIAAGLREAAVESGIRAAGICYDVRISEEPSGDAIQVDLEHRLGDLVAVAVPYSRQQQGGYLFEAPFAMPLASRVFNPTG